MKVFFGLDLLQVMYQMYFNKAEPVRATMESCTDPNNIHGILRIPYYCCLLFAYFIWTLCLSSYLFQTLSPILHPIGSFSTPRQCYGISFGLMTCRKGIYFV